ncbi:MAG TPA: GNAT family N-acetyltransferase [Gaiellaceae bacterium]|nr:GNAT family N-acetyltransferase [Gaiellaceae bacterium]
MRELPIAWTTDLAVREHSGSTVDDRGDHVIVRTPENPTYHWGNCLLVTDTDTRDEAERWIGVFDEAFPAATWKAIGLPAMPRVPSAWTDRGLELELDDVLTTRVLPRQTPLVAPYSVRSLEADDWEQLVAAAMADNARTGEWPPHSHEPFVRARARADLALSERGLASFFGAFSGETLAASLGIVLCGTTARYRNVGTDAAHRRRGLASHLLGVAARWAGERGCDRWVIVTESTNPAGRVYRSVGFQLDVPTVQAYRRPGY